MSKPIFIVQFPSTTTKDHAEHIVHYFNKKLVDYNVFIVGNTENSWDFKLFSDKEIEPIELEKLKGLIDQ
jgi:hypothetical protein